jgi:hypothetical protein
MINALHLLWIVPLSMIAGAALLIVFACILAKEEDRKLREDEECIENDNRNA